MLDGRAKVIEQVVEQLLADYAGDRPRRVGVVGITAAGNTTWARELTGAFRATAARRCTCRPTTSTTRGPTRCCGESVVGG